MPGTRAALTSAARTLSRPKCKGASADVNTGTYTATVPPTAWASPALAHAIPRLPSPLPSQIDFLLLISRQGKVRLAKWYGVQSPKEKARITREVAALVLARAPKMCNFLEWKERKLVYKRYASLFFVTSIGHDDNELLALEVIHHYVEVLDKYFGDVCELDIIFNFHKAYYILDELLIGGELQETNKRELLRVTAAQDELSRDADEGVVVARR
jgi:AP-1 complex subunit sigma 1/2